MPRLRLLAVIVATLVVGAGCGSPDAGDGQLGSAAPAAPAATPSAGLSRHGGPTGVVQWYSDQKYYGFIDPDDGSRSIFFHGSFIDEPSGRLDQGDRVAYTVEETPKGVRATHVRLLRD